MANVDPKPGNFTQDPSQHADYILSRGTVAVHIGQGQPVIDGARTTLQSYIPKISLSSSAGACATATATVAPTPRPIGAQLSPPSRVRHATPLAAT